MYVGVQWAGPQPQEILDSFIVARKNVVINVLAAN